MSSHCTGLKCMIPTDEHVLGPDWMTDQNMAMCQELTVHVGGV